MSLLHPMMVIHFLQCSIISRLWSHAAAMNVLPSHQHPPFIFNCSIISRFLLLLHSCNKWLFIPWVSFSFHLLQKLQGRMPISLPWAFIHFQPPHNLILRPTHIAPINVLTFHGHPFYSIPSNLLMLPCYTDAAKKQLRQQATCMHSPVGNLEEH